MNSFFRNIIFITSIIFLSSCNTHVADENKLVLIRTTSGDIKIRLYDGTPLHRDNFIRLVNRGFYNDVTFHRVIKDFMIQAGDPSTRLSSSQALPDSINTYTLPAEFNTSYFHKRGALAAAREGNEQNPAMRSSGTQFYIVQGVTYTDEQLDQAQVRINSNIKQGIFTRLLKQVSDSLRSTGKTPSEAEVQDIASVKMFDYLSSWTDHKIPDDQRNTYRTIGGVPRLDGTYTVFGEVIEGMDVVDKIASVSTDNSDRPLTAVRILKMKIVNK